MIFVSYMKSIPIQVMPLYWAFCVLGGSLVTEGGTLLMAMYVIKDGARKRNMSFTEYGK